MCIARTGNAPDCCCQIAGILVLNSHRASDASGEGFAVRLFRAANRRGFVRALSDQPTSLSAGFAKVCVVGVGQAIWDTFLAQLCSQYALRRGMDSI